MKTKPSFDEVVVRRKRIRFKFWPSEKGSTSDETPQYVGVMTPIKLEDIDAVEKAISKKYNIKGIYCTKL